MNGTSAGWDRRATRESWPARCRHSRGCRRRAPRPPQPGARRAITTGKASMVGVFKQPVTAADIKAKARELGADLVGIADGELMNRNPPDPNDPRRPIDVSELDYRRVIVLAKHLNNGVARIMAWGDRTKFYNDELALSAIEEISLEL